MTTPITNADYASQKVALEAEFKAGTISAPDYITALTALVNDWTVGAITPTQLGIELSGALGNWNSFVSAQLEWMTTTPTGGPHGDGTIDLIDYLGNITTIPGLQLLSIEMERGLPAKNDMAFYFQGAFRANELCGVFRAAEAMSFVSSGYAVANTGPTTSRTIRFTKNGTFVNPAAATDAEIIAALWATVTFAAPGTAGQPSLGTLAYAGASTLAQGDVVRSWAPLVQDTAMADVSITFGGA